MLHLEDVGGKEKKERCRGQKNSMCLSRYGGNEVWERNERKRQCRMTITEEHSRLWKKRQGTAGQNTIQYLRLWQGNVHDVRLAPGFAIFKPREDDLVAPDLAMLLALQWRLPGNPDCCGVYGLNFELPGGCSGHLGGKERCREQARE